MMVKKLNRDELKESLPLIWSVFTEFEACNYPEDGKQAFWNAMWDNESGIDTTFRDIEELICRCRFSDCSHGSEPGCAVQKALADGTLNPARWESYLKLKTENQFAIDGSQYLEAKRAKFKEISKTNKANRKRH